MILGRRRPNVARLARRGRVEALIEALSYRDWTETRSDGPVDLGVRARLQAVAALAPLDDERARSALHEAVTADPAPAVRLAAIDATRDDDAAEVAAFLARAALQPSVQDGRPRAAALERLRDRPKEGIKGVARVLVEAPAGNDTGPACDLLRALALRTRQINPAARVLVTALADPASREAAQAGLVALGPQAVKALIAALRDPLRAAAAATALGATGDARAVQPLASALDNPSPELRRAALLALGRLADPQSAPAVLAAADDPDYEVRRTAVQVINTMGGVGTLAAVAGALRESAGAANGEIGADSDVVA
ncbi:MAG: HEAT repeat domain-containing protein [Solirubrobacteraceae bacterium]